MVNYRCSLISVNQPPSEKNTHHAQRNTSLKETHDTERNTQRQKDVIKTTSLKETHEMERNTRGEKTPMMKRSNVGTS
jgi:hypothetical protein